MAAGDSHCDGAIRPRRDIFGGCVSAVFCQVSINAHNLSKIIQGDTNPFDTNSPVKPREPLANSDIVTPVRERLMDSFRIFKRKEILLILPYVVQQGAS